MQFLDSKTLLNYSSLWDSSSSSSSSSVKWSICSSIFALSVAKRNERLCLFWLIQRLRHVLRSTWTAVSLALNLQNNLPLSENSLLQSADVAGVSSYISQYLLFWIIIRLFAKSSIIILWMEIGVWLKLKRDRAWRLIKPKQYLDLERNWKL